MKKGIRELVGICGLYCGTCPQYLAWRENDVELIKKISESRGIPLEKVRCDGCLSENVFEPCIDCRPGFRRCAKEHNVNWCFECFEFPCQRNRDFINAHIVDGISHHEHVVEDLYYMKEHGIEAWVEQKDKEGRCPACGKMLYWSAKKCPYCHTGVR